MFLDWNTSPITLGTPRSQSEVEHFKPRFQQGDLAENLMFLDWNTLQVTIGIPPRS
jgi:hypothetical protein